MIRMNVSDKNSS